MGLSYGDVRRFDDKLDEIKAALVAIKAAIDAQLTPEERAVVTAATEALKGSSDTLAKAVADNTPQP